ncbi:hypothetical protein KBY86_02045 [Synechococcus sp. Lug-A]|uniref:hypothetical protein n=1 Tax=Synechococcus sp. Lug-A TaxID=2823740 RepID=UPI0020CF1FF8|nr:hypothetical protein [Synechococcus sp. Lug-A]MCP9845683.1 hypothetical protein [Synechococcus sp. Lug-A]
MNPHLTKASQDIRHMLGLLVINYRRRGNIDVGDRIRQSITTWLARETIPMSWLMKIPQLHDQQPGLAEGAQGD